MADEPRDQNNRSLEEMAAEISEGLDGQSVEMNESSTGQVRAGQVRMNQSAARSVEASALHMENSAALLVRSGSVDADSGSIGVVVARDVKMEKVFNSVTVARHVEATEARSAVLIAGKVEGNVKTVFTPLIALAVGAGFGLVMLLAKQLGARLFLSSSGKSGLSGKLRKK